LSQQPEGAAVPTVLAEVHQADQTSTEFYRRFVALTELGIRTRQQIDDLADEPSYNLYVEAVDGIITTFEQLNMRESWGGYKAAFNQRALAHLEICELALERRLTATPPSAEVLREALSCVQEAISDVLEADIEAEAKLLLLEMLREGERAILAYHISGLAGLRHAVERMFGALAVNCHGSNHTTRVAP
jgi:hypothetical protein